ncbi:cation:proton antiporter [Hyalangium gracile]|uniref:cation:proton antiporter n=1 Tax=Hyalangium gracile TaxID=394092 RepID=UPI001CCB02E8|nr:cation:proton antiporter [Hyalangium gracile]
MANLWFVVVGVLLIFMALSGALLKRLPLSSSLVYLVAGYGLGRLGAASLAPLKHMHLLERVSEAAVIISLFAAGLKLRLPLRDRAWRLPLRLAFGAMALTVALLTLGGLFLGLPLGAAVLLGAVLAPTDPVLASEVQVTHSTDTDRLRFGLTGEAGLNDGTAFPFVMLGLGLLGHHALGTNAWRWVAVDVLWAVTGGLLIGWGLGGAVGRLVVFLRRVHKEAVGLDDFLALGLIALAYGVSLWVHAYGFLAVFAAGLSLRRMEARTSGARAPEDVMAMAVSGRAEEVAVHPETASAYMTQAVLGFTEQLERMGEVALMLMVGIMLATVGFAWEGIALTCLLLFGVRPVSVALLTMGTGISTRQRALIAWFGIRGIGSLYYLFYALTHGMEPTLGERLTRFVLAAVAISAVLHGVSATPLMTWYSRRN